jgi:hypothetical protein
MFKEAMFRESMFNESMFKESLALLLAGLMIVTSGGTYAVAQAKAKNDPQEHHASKVKACVRRLGTGESSRVNVELYDKTKLSGYIAEIGEDQFILREVKTGKDTNVAYASVKKLRGSSPGLGRTVALGAGAYQSKTVLIVLAVLFAGLLALVASDKS